MPEENKREEEQIFDRETFIKLEIKNLKYILFQ